MPILTRELIFKGQSKFGGWNRKQLAAIDIAWPLPIGWIDEQVGRFVTDEAAEQFLALRGEAGYSPVTRKKLKKRERLFAARHGNQAQQAPMPALPLDRAAQAPLVERVAQAIYGTHATSEHALPWEEVDNDIREYVRAQARAALSVTDNDTVPW